MKAFLRTTLGIAAIAVAMPAAAVSVLDLTVAGNNGFVNEAFFTTVNAQSTGTGVINPFVRISQANSDIVEGYNTSARPLTYQENSSPQFTKDLLLSAVPTVVINGVTYREFLLDINQEGADPLLSLNEIQIFVQGTGGLSGLITNNTVFTNKVFDLDVGADADSRIELNYNLNAGSGSGDMLAYIPDALFVGGTHVYFYSQFGAPNNNNAGFEEWAVRVAAPIPEPSTYALMLAGLGAVGFMARRRRNG